MKGVVLSLAFDLVMILSLLGMMRSPLTIVWTTRGSFKAYSFERAMTLQQSVYSLITHQMDLLLSNLIVSSKVDGILQPLAKNDLQAILSVNLDLRQEFNDVMGSNQGKSSKNQNQRLDKCRSISGSKS